MLFNTHKLPAAAKASTFSAAEIAAFKTTFMRANLLYILGAVVLSACSGHSKKGNVSGSVTTQTEVQKLNLPEPHETKSTVNFSKVVGWGNLMPVPPDGFKVTKYAEDIRSCRWVYVLPNGDVLVSQANTEAKGLKKAGSDLIGASKSQHMTGSPNQITLLRDANKDGIPEVRETFLSDLNQPFGMLLIGNDLYVGVTDALWKFPYKPGDLKITGEGQKIADLPAGGYNNHWTRNIITNHDQSKIYISVGSGSNVAEHGFENEIRRANILEINLDGSGERIYASGLRNPVGMAWNPVTGELWTAVNERDKLGDDLVPDYATSVKEGGFYGWPYSYFGQHLDPRIDEKDQKPELVKKALVPDVALGSHTASLGLAFYTKTAFPEKYRNGLFIGQHGSWNRKELSGYKVVFVPFKNGKPSGEPEDFLSGFISDLEQNEVHGRPVCVAVLPDGSMLVTDDASDIIWKVSYGK